MKSLTLSLALSFALATLCPSSTSAADDASHPAVSVAAADFSADDFDWREMIPYLSTAANMPSEQGLKIVLENSKVLRAYVANEMKEDCGAHGCGARADASASDDEVNKAIDKMVQEEVSHRKKTAVVEYPLKRQPFPFSSIAAFKSDDHPDAYLILEFSPGYTATDLQAKYGAPYDTDIFQWYSVFKYREEKPEYTSKAYFEVNPVDGMVIKVAISLKPRKPKHRH